MMAKLRTKVFPIFLLTSVLALSGCSTLSEIGNDSYDSADHHACDTEREAKARMDCYAKADEARRVRDLARSEKEK